MKSIGRTKSNALKFPLLPLRRLSGLIYADCFNLLIKVSVTRNLLNGLTGSVLFEQEMLIKGEINDDENFSDEIED